MSGKNKEAENAQTQLSREQAQTSREMLGFFKDRTAKMDQYQQPAIDFATKLASGDPQKMLQVSAVPIGNINQSYKNTREQIYDSLPAGAARDFALASSLRDKNVQIGGTLNQGYLQAFNTLMNIGNQQGAFGLQEAGAGINSGQAATNTNQSLMNASAQRKASTMNFLGSLAQAGGMAAGGR